MGNLKVGIDLGTTFSCMAYINDDGEPEVIKSSSGGLTTPSVIHFNGKKAYVGDKAIQRKIAPSSPIFEFIKRDIGKPIEPTEDIDFTGIAPYRINGFAYGSAGMSAIILRKFKKDAIKFFQRLGKLESNLDDSEISIEAVITVPAYFGDVERNETKLAAFAAGFEVRGIINEPTAAALAFGQKLQEQKKIMVFDLGGGTFDVTILEFNLGEDRVLGSNGANTLGGKDFDALIEGYLYEEYERLTDEEIPNDLGFDIQKYALDAKFDLTNNESTIVNISTDNHDVDITLFREKQEKDVQIDFDSISDETVFYFEERATSLMQLCSVITQRLLDSCGVSWNELDDIVMAGGACRMPMINKLMEKMSGRKLPPITENLKLDTSIALGAALYSNNIGELLDVTSKTIGVLIMVDGQKKIDHLIRKNLQVPIIIKERYNALANTELEIYEGDSDLPDECKCIGKLRLMNEPGICTVSIQIDKNGILSAKCKLDGCEEQTVNLSNSSFDFSFERANKLHEMIQKINIIL